MTHTRIAIPRHFTTAALLLLAATQGCGGNTTAAPTAPTLAIETPSLTLTPATTTITTAQILSVAIAITATAGYPTPTGTISLTSGTYTSSATTLAAGAATISIPAIALSPGTDTLTAKYTPDTASAPDFNPTSATASITVTAATTITSVTATSVTYPTAGSPFQALVSSAGTVFVTVPTGIQVFTPAAGALTATCVNTFPAALASQGAAASELSYLPGSTNIAVGISSPGAAFYNAAALQTCTAIPTVISQGTIASAQGTQAIAVTPDGKYAFVSNEYGIASGAVTEGNIGVVALQYDAAGNVSPTSTLLGQISTGGQAIAGMTLSPDGTRLYVTSEIASNAAQAAASGTANPILARTGCVQQVGGNPQINGLLTVINVAKAEAAPTSAAILTTIDAGCSPVRMAETANNAILWVAIRGDNRVLAFSTALLESNPNTALLGFAGTGTAPVGITLFHADQLLAVADSNRFNTGLADAIILAVANPAAATVLATIPTGLFPREITLGPDGGTLYLTNYTSATLQVISTTVK